MNFNIETIDSFDKELKKLSKKYPSIKKDFGQLLDNLQKDPMQGKPLGKDCYKVRMAISSKNRGKSGGGRVITCVKIIKETIYLLAIYDKSDIENLNDNELVTRLEQVL